MGHKKEGVYLYTPWGGAEGVKEQEPVLVNFWGGGRGQGRGGTRRKKKDIKLLFKSLLESFYEVCPFLIKPP